MVINVYSPDSAKIFEEYEKFMHMLTRVMVEGRREGARGYFVAGDLNVDLALLCLEDSDDLKDICGPQCLHGVEAELGGLKKAMWLEMSTGSSCQALANLFELCRPNSSK